MLGPKGHTYKGMPLCSSCVNGYGGAFGDIQDGVRLEADKADYYVTGSISDGYKSRPYRAYLCSNHLAMMEEDGLVVKSLVCVS